MNIIGNYSISITTKFILPMVFNNNVTFADLPIYTYNTYLSIIDEPEYDDKIIIVSKERLPDFLINKEFLYKVEKKQDNYFTIFNPPNEEDIYSIISGRYSELSLEYKHKLLYFWKQDKDSQLFGVLYKDFNSRFSYNEYMLNESRITKVKEYYSKPLYTELIYGLDL